ncbi:response regulator [Reyranella sp.]|uniref:response regulator n=1 Tax=Reyranella sp. TaxID=1929291 RepID=UPI003D0A57E4
MSSVLLAEDEFLIRAVLVDALGDSGMTCIEAATGQAALDVLAGDTPLAAVIVDLGLPDMSGERVIEAAVRHRPGTPIIQCSGSHLRPPDVAGQKIHVFSKPYNAEELSRFVAALVRGAG